jgi:hypothetical protein
MKLFWNKLDVGDLTTSTEIMHSDAVRGPALSHIKEVLEKNNINAYFKTVDMNVCNR